MTPDPGFELASLLRSSLERADDQSCGPEDCKDPEKRCHQKSERHKCDPCFMVHVSKGAGLVACTTAQRRCQNLRPGDKCGACFDDWWRLSYIEAATLKPCTKPTKRLYSQTNLNHIAHSNTSRKRKLVSTEEGSRLEPKAKKRGLLNKDPRLPKHSIKHATGWVPINCSCAHAIKEASDGGSETSSKAVSLQPLALSEREIDALQRTEVQCEHPPEYWRKCREAEIRDPKGQASGQAPSSRSRESTGPEGAGRAARVRFDRIHKQIDTDSLQKAPKKRPGNTPLSRCLAASDHVRLLTPDSIDKLHSGNLWRDHVAGG